MAKMHSIGLRLTTVERDALERAAAEAEVSLSGLTRVILTDLLREAGWLEKARLPTRKVSGKTPKPGASG